ncbi:DUF4232 domain-containing protein [Streptomyces cellulosae]|uniref:DUF4232 domain-containing protein n=1 Tax=Streptomyces cellulosae TaxID=1968 RepID=A0ABW7YHV4_STRCE
MRARRIRLIAATGATLAALALTACQDGTGTKDEGASRPTATTSTGRPTATPTSTTGTPDTAPATTTPGKPTTSNGKVPASARKPAPEAGPRKTSDPDPNAPENRVLCNGSNTTVTAQPVSRPVNHMLITVKNTGSKVCDLTYYPVLRFDEMQWAPQPFEDSKPQAVTTLAPGESGYAGVLLSSADGSGDGGTTGRRLTVAFQGATPNSSGGASATPSLPAKGVYYDSSLRVTYWQREMSDALAY